MAKFEVSNIVVGEGKIFAGPSRAVVDASITASGDDSQYNLGGTQGGISIAWEPTMVDIDVDQAGDAARVIQSKQKIMIKTVLAEGTLFNLALAWGYDTSVGSTAPGLRTGFTDIAGTMNLGIHSVYPSEKYVRFEGNGPGSTSSVTTYRTYKCSRVIQFSASEHALNRTENVKFAVDLRVLPDTSQTGAEYGTIVDSPTAPYSPYL